MSDAKEHGKPPEWKDVIAILGLRLADSGLLPWMVVAGFLLCLFWLPVRNLDSKDSLALMTHIGSLRGLAWAGWVVALIEIPIAKWALNRARNLNSSRIKQLEEDVVKTREKLREHRQSELKLEGKG